MRRIYILLASLLCLAFLLCGCDEEIPSDVEVWKAVSTSDTVTSDTEKSEPVQTGETTFADESAALGESLISEDTGVSEFRGDTTEEKAEETFEEAFLKVRFIDVGQAEAALVECDGHFMLIDGGDKKDSSLIYSVLRAEGIEKIDIVVASHAHEDHVGGIPGAYNYTTADLTLCPVTSFDTEAFNDFARYAESRGGGITVPTVGDVYRLGGAEVRIIGVNSTPDENDASIILKIVYGETSFLFTGDAQRGAEQVLLESGEDLSATVLKVGHHGSSDATSYPFLRAVKPKFAVIYAGKENGYGHPADAVLSRLRDADVEVYRTDMQGDVYFLSDGRNISVSVTKNRDADTYSNPGDGPVFAAPFVTEGTTKVTTEETTKVTTTATTKATTTAAPVAKGTDYVLNKNTYKFHYPSCSSVKQMKEKNKRYFNGSRDEVIAMGYDPCGRCHP